MNKENKEINKNIDAIKNYFTEEKQDQIRNMTNEDMRDLLRGLEETPVWIAILKYSQSRVASINDYFIISDPNTEATKIARYQGAVTGILDLQDAVLSLKFESKKAEDPENKVEQAKTDLRGAYGKY